MKFALIFLSILLVYYSPAQENRTGVPVRLSECVAAALEKNAAMKIGKARVFAAEAKSDEAGTALLPQIKLSGRIAQLSAIDPFALPPPFPAITLFPSIERNFAARLSLQQPVFTGFRLKRNQEIAELNVSAVREDLTKEQADLVLNVTSAYWNLYRALEMESVISQTVGQVSEHYKDIQSFARQGLATDVDVMKVNVQLSDVRVKQIEARSNIRLAAMALNNLIGNPLEFEITLAEVPTLAAQAESVSVAELQTMIVKARSQRPEMKSMQFRKNMSDAGVSAARGGWFPQIMLAANYDYARPNQRIIPPKDQWDDSWDVGLSLQWNIWDWFATSYQTSQAEAVVRQTDAGFEQLNDAIALEVAQNYFRAHEAKEKVAVAAIGTGQAKETYRITSEKFKRGVASNTELLDAELALLQAKLTQTHATVDYVLARARLKRAVGEGN